MASENLCIYHGNCADGFAAAWVVRKRFGSNCDFHPGVYQDDPPEVSGRHVVLVDFSYKRQILERMRDRALSITILDHHKTAEEDLKGLLGVSTVFDMERSGARIAWDYFFPDQEPPKTLLHVEDRDLWRFSLAKTREIQAAIFSFPYEFSVWDRLMAADPKELVKEGEAIERKHAKDVRELLGVVTRKMRIGGYEVPVANLPYTHVSDAGNILAEGEPFAGCYWDTPKGRVFGLRSAASGLDVSEIAKQYGGGGHPHAAGFTVSYVRARELEVE
ncbi:MAG: phosphohydrolase [Gemmatimonadales bacterium]|nr:MAG: phosphohydrolase [Gemmatimonadales bacterium]